MNTSCAMSLIQKRCPRRQFDCQRCGARLLNSGKVWELTVPTYERWYYEYAVPRPTGNSFIFTATPQSFYGGCRASGSSSVNFTNPDPHATSSAGWPQWVLDFTFDWFEGDLPFTFEFDEQTWTSWLWFQRTYNATVGFNQAVMDGSEIVTPGYWYVALDIYNNAWYHLERTIPIDSHNAANDFGLHTYIAPENFNCKSSDSFRFTRAETEFAGPPPYIDVRIKEID